VVKEPNNFSHLIGAETQSIANRSAAKRIDWIRHDRWYNLLYAAELLSHLKNLKDHNRGNVRPRCARIVAPSGMAKTYILQQFLKLHPPSRVNKATNIRRPVFLLDLPIVPTIEQLLLDMLVLLEAPTEKLSVRSYKQQALNLLVAAGAQIIVLDEFNRITAAKIDAEKAVGEVLKWLAKELRIPVVVAGTAAMNGFFAKDEQLNKRFKSYEISKWSVDEEFQAVVSTIFAYMPLREPPEESIFEKVGLEALMVKAGEATDDVIDFVKSLAIDCLENGQERITLDHIVSAA
jgi:hypothetical protein